MPGIDHNFILFVTACNCCRMQTASPNWRPSPEITVPLNLPPVTVHDWVNPPTDDMVVPRIATRRFRLRDETVIGPGRIIYTYEEVQ